MLRYALLAVFFAATAAFYTSSDDVIELTPDTFNKKVTDGDEVWLVEFYAPWCGHCQSLAPAWKQAAKALKGVVKVGAVDADKHGSLAQQFQVQGFPSIKIFGANKRSPTEYKSGRDARSIVTAGLDAAKTVAMDRLSGGGGSSGGGKRSSGGSEKDVVELTDSNFEEIVYGTEDMVMVEFFAPWCGHCKSLEPHWAKAASELKGKVIVAALDATVHTVMSNRFGVGGFPTIKVFPSGKKSSPSDAVDYDGPRDADGIIAYALDKVAENIPPPEIKEIVSKESFDEACGKSLCVIAFLPIIYDCQSECRNKNIDMLKALADKHKKKMWGWLWAEAIAQPKLEEALGVGGFGYPALVALNAKKLKYAMFKGSFGEDGIHDFLRTVAVGRGGSFSLPSSGLPDVLSTEPWDGKDKALPTEEDDEKDEL